MERVGTRGLESELQLEHVVELQPLLVVVVGLERERTDHRIVAFAALVPVARDVVLEKLEVAVAAKRPEVGLAHDDVERDIVEGGLRHGLYL